MEHDIFQSSSWKQCGLAPPSISGDDFGILTNANRFGTGLDIWLVSREDLIASVNPQKTVSKDEIIKANSQRMRGDSTRILASRFLLRHALSWKVENAIDPHDWKFIVGEYGKPTLETNFNKIDFNISYAGSLIAVAVSSTGKVGVDIEKYPATDTPVDDALSDNERRYLEGLDQAQTNLEFTKLWTLKEACAKALGYGASLSFNNIDVSLEPLGVNVEAGEISELPTLIPTLQIIQHNGESICLAAVETR